MKRVVSTFGPFLVLLVLAAPAHATFPGANGRLVYVLGGGGLTNTNVFTSNPDGSGQMQLTNGTMSIEEPRWRPDGQKIAFHTYRNQQGAFVMNSDGSDVQPLSPSNPQAWVSSWSPDGQRITYSVPPDFDPDSFEESKIAVANADGTDETILTTGPADLSPVWSPDGQKIAFERHSISYNSDCECYYVGAGDIWVMNADGTGQTDLTAGAEPNWSPDGHRIVFDGVYTMNADGSNQRYTGARSGGFPVWSPDGTKVVFTGYYGNGGVYTMNADGSSVTPIPNVGYYPDWQPLPVPDYPHPQSAPQFQVSLVPAFRQCATGGNPANSKHAPSLAVDSCNPPRPGSAVAAVGGASQSSATFTSFPGDTDPTNGNSATFGITLNMTDIQGIAGGDYDPNPGADMTEVTRLRITDKANGYGGLPATATEYDLRVPIDCTPTADPSVGSTCAASTTANALYSRFIIEQQKTIVQAFRVRIDDAGANGTPGDADDRIFATQGVFVP